MMQLTKQQEMMIEDGAPPCFVTMTQAERTQAWKENPPKPMPAFSIAPKMSDTDTLNLIAELNAEKKLKSENKKVKKAEKEIDRTGQRWDPRSAKFVDENELFAARRERAMITLTTNTRGSTKMSKDFAELNLAEMATAYNKISGKDPIKKFKDKATGLKRLAEATSAKNAAKATAVRSVSAAKPTKTQKEPKEGSANKLAAEFGCRVGSFREKLIIALDESYRKMVKTEDLLKAVYGSKNIENTGALTMVLKGAQTMIEKNKLPYILKKEKVEGEISHGLYPK